MEFIGSRKQKPSSPQRAMALATRCLLLKRFSRAPPSSSCCRRYNPDGGAMGFLSAVKDPAAACLRVVGPVRSSAHAIMEATLPFLHSCGLCRRWIGGGPVYIYKGEIGFCKPECRDEYIVQEERAKIIRQEQADAVVSKKTPVLDDGCIFFTCTDR